VPQRTTTRLLDGFVSVVAGVGPGIGRAIAMTLAEHGSDVVLAARTPTAMAEIAHSITAAGQRSLCVATDITDPDQCARLAQTVQEQFGQVDLLVNNAVFAPDPKMVEDEDTANWRQALEVNVLGALHVAKAFIPMLRRQGSGSVVMVGSLVTRRIVPYFGAYTSAKAALMAMGLTLARELGDAGVRVNNILPGYVHTPATDTYFDDLAMQTGRPVDHLIAEVTREIALGRLVTTDDVAKVVVFLASDLAAGVTGQSIDVNCGHFIH
jgi:NAD(P)-dependent dehydrogenase (short-subunit alcohol dehydrogenase family)